MKKKKIIIILIIFVMFLSLIIVACFLNKNKTNDITTTKIMDLKENETTYARTEELTSEITTTETTTTTKKNKDTTTKVKDTTNKTTTKKESTKKTTTKTTTTTTLNYTIETREEVDEETKYGTVIKTVYKVKVKIYNDGREEETERKKSKTIIDASNYNGTTDTLKSEALNVVSSNNDTYNEMLSYVNTYRSEVSISPLTIDANLNLAATIRAMEMAYADKFSHTRPNGSDCFTIINELGISSYIVGENIASGQRNVAAVSGSWKNSSGHYANMISTNFNKVGFGKYKFNNVIYWVQIFSN